MMLLRWQQAWLFSSCMVIGSLLVSANSSPYSLSVVFEGETSRVSLSSKTNLSSRIGWSVFNNSINQTGWSYLEVYTSGKYGNDEQAYAAGWVEGYATRDLISMSWINMGFGQCSTKPLSQFCKHLVDYISRNTKWIQSMINKNPKDPYWEQVKLLYYQTSGLIDGYRNVTGFPRFDVDVTTLFFMQIDGDMGAIQASFSHQSGERYDEDGHCSALIKLLPGFKDLYAAQDTWTEYQQMLRILKKYNFEFYLTSDHREFVPVRTMTFSSYPGFLSSGDDFYVLSNGLVSMETTIGNSNAARWKYVTPENAVIEGIRSVVANRLAGSGQQWAHLFSQYNSGTYNNQWMVVDYNQFEPGEKPRPGTLYVTEQIPGMMISRDLTELLISQTYFASYNTPYFPEIFNASGGPESVKKYGDWFTYEHTPRANIFRRDHVKVHDTQSMTRLMRYNDFEVDPLSRCNCTPPYSAENAISARCDLNPANGKYPFGALGHRPHGGIDMKLTSSSLRKSLDFIAVSSPTFDDVPPFQWSTSDYDKKLSHIGHPDKWQFAPIHTHWSST